MAERRTEAVRTERRLTLREHEIQRLNTFGVVEIPLDPRVVLPSDRNSRLARVVVEPDGTRIAGGGPETYLEVTFEPADWSVLRWSDEAYLFQYGLKREANLVRWGFSWNSGGEIVPPFDSTGDDAAMLGAASSAERMRFGRWRAQSLIWRRFHPAGATAQVESLAMVLTVDKHKARPGAIRPLSETLYRQHSTCQLIPFDEKDRSHSYVRSVGDEGG